jgi:ribosomal protein L7/L12
MGLYFRVAPGLKLRATGRGLRVGVGPRGARLWMGAGGTGVSTGAGPVSFYKGLGSGSRRGASASLTAYEREVRQAQQAEQMTKLANQLQRMLSIHQTEFPVAQRPVAPVPQPVDLARLEQEAGKEAKSALFFLKRSARRVASESARAAAREEAAREDARRQQQQRELQQELDVAWQRLLSNDPETVIAALEGAFADNDAPAVPVDCVTGRATVLMVMDPEEAFPERVPRLTPTGKPSSRQLSKTERSELYLGWMSSNILATVREALATAPAVHAVTVVVLKKSSPTPFGEIPLGVVYAGTFSREMADRIVWERPEALDAILYADGLLMRSAGRTKQLVEIDLSDHPDLLAVVDEVRQAFRDSPEAFQTDIAFDVVLLAPGDKKIQLIKVIRQLTSLGLGEAKALVDDTPSVIVAGAARREAEATRQALMEVGAGVQAEVTPSGR